MKRAHSWARCAAVMPATPLVGQCRRPARAEHHPGRVTAGDPLQTAAPHRDSWAAGSGTCKGDEYLAEGGDEDGFDGVQRFSAWSNTMLVSESKTSPVTSSPDVIPVWSMISRPTTVLVSWNAGRQCMNFDRGFPLCPTDVRVHLIRPENSHPFRPDVLGLAHGDPHIGVDEVDARTTASAASSVTVIRAPVLPAMPVARSTTSFGGCKLLGTGEPDVAAHQRAHDEERAAHVEAAVADEGVGEARR